MMMKFIPTNDPTKIMIHATGEHKIETPEVDDSKDLAIQHEYKKNIL